MNGRNLSIGVQYGNPAHATYTLDWAAPGGWISKNLNITLYVNGYSAWGGH